MSAEGRRSSFFTLTGAGRDDDTAGIERVEIPLFQRDYAQGRQDEAVEQIRADFLDAIATAVIDETAAPLGLDFVYGGVEGGALRPLDGQQRLTTLFLLHWYLASRSGNLDPGAGWTRFTYATRQSARMFCERLVEFRPPDEAASPRDSIPDQPWYLFLWRHDPTIQSMLVMLGAIHERFRDVDVNRAWARLTDPDNPAVWFLLLPLEGLGSETDRSMRAEDLYIKMNSRGKPLTEFENFKANFEKTITASPRAHEFALKVDTAWSDLLWHLRSNGDLVDEELIRYLTFVTEICEWRDGRTDGASRRIGPRTREVFGHRNPQSQSHLDFLFDALDVWVARWEQDGDDAISAAFRRFFGADEGRGDGQTVRLFFRSKGSLTEPLNLFESCCRAYGRTSGRTRDFSLGQTLILYAVVIHLVEGTEDFTSRVRILRNLVEASSDQLRPERMPELLDDVHRVIRLGDIDAVTTFNQVQVEDEKSKVALLHDHPELRPVLWTLEDHEFLRGSLGAFEYDPSSFERRATAFHEVMSQPELWPKVLRALLAVGEYQRRRTNSRPFLFGTDSTKHSNAWRELLTGASQERLRATRETMGAFLDIVACADTLRATLDEVVDVYLARCEDEQRFDWRYYMVRYPAMQSGGSSTYFAEPMDGAPAEMGYSLCMLKAGGRALNGWYRDPYLLAVTRELEDKSIVEDKWFSGYESHPRRLPLARSGASIRCVPAGFELGQPGDAFTDTFAAACSDLGVGADMVVGLPQVEIDGRRVDTIDRIQLGAEIVRKLAAAGL